jgi:hypothetical protein
MKYLYIIMIMVGAVLLSGCSLNSSNLSEDVNMENEMSTNWSTYKSAVYDFSFDYPSDWIVDDDDREYIAVKSSENTGCSCGGPVPPQAGEMMTVRVYEAPNETIELIRDAHKNEGCSVSEIKQINGVDFFRYENCPDCCAGYPGYIAVKDKLSYDFYGTYWPWDDSSNIHFEEMVQTIQFEE